MTSSRERPGVSDAELGRRQATVCDAMAAEGLDALVCYGQNEHVNGYVRYLTGVPPCGGYPDWLVLSRESESVYVTHGAFDGDQAASEVPLAPCGVDRVLTTAAFASARNTATYEPALVVKTLRRLGAAAVGLAGLHQMPYVAVEQLRQQLPEVRFVDGADLLDAIKARKSAEEFDLIRQTARLQDEAMRAAFDAVEPGMRDSDVARVAEQRSVELGSEYGCYMCGSGPPGEPAFIQVPQFQNRTIEAGDSVVLLVENVGPGGYFGELARTCVLGAAPESMREGFDRVRIAQEACVETIRPGSQPAEIWDAYNTYMEEQGLPPETRLHCHGQGIEMVERPLVRFDETLPITESVLLACHPSSVESGYFHFVCDNFLFGEDGRLDRLHRFPAEIVEK